MRFAVYLCVIGLAAAVIGLLSMQSPSTVNAMSMGNPTGGYSLHIDADKHFGDAHPGEIAHHWCKAISTTLTECELFDSDGPHARLVGVETIVPSSVWKTFPPAEQALWHYHRVELQKVHATLPDTPKDQQAKVVAAIRETYGKVYILWDPMSSKYPMGQPSITILR